MTVFSRLLDAHHLYPITVKLEILTFTKSHKVKREPTMLIYSTSFHHVQHMKVLGITIDKYLNWTAFIKQFIPG